MSHWQFHSNNETDTDALGAALAAALPNGFVMALHGDLGAGKTRFVQSVAVAMGVDREDVNSPTFVLLQEYHGVETNARRTIYHFDAYRLRDSDEFLELGADEVMESSGVCFIEWAERVADVLPADRLHVEIEPTGEMSRLFKFIATGDRAARVLADLQARVNA